VALAAARRRSNGPAAAEVTKQRAGRPAEMTMRFINAVICVNAFAPKGKMWRCPASRGSPSSLVRCATDNFPTFPRHQLSKNPCRPSAEAMEIVWSLDFHLALADSHLAAIARATFGLDCYFPA
jgi:hypothetical protein